MKFDEILGEIGEFGRYQRWVYLMVWITVLPGSIHQMAQVFLDGDSDHWCDVAAWSDEDCSAWGYTEEQCIEAKRNASSPINGTEEQLQCYKYSMVDDLVFHPGLNPKNYNDTELIECNDGWVYDTSQYKSSIIQDYDLVCDDENKNSLSQSMYFVGVLVGSLVFGVLSDIVGRRYTLFACLFLEAAIGVGIAFAPTYWVFTGLRTVLAAVSYGVFLLAFVIGTEFVGSGKRNIAAFGIQMSFSTGYILLAVFAYFIREWWILQLVISAPTFLMLLFYPFLPESVRWLICVGRTEDAEVIITKAAKVNKKKLPEPIFTDDEIDEQQRAASESQGNALDLFKTPNLRVRTLNLMFNWFVNTLVYYGLSLSTSDLGVGDYLGFLISGLVEIPAYITAIFAIDYFGRKWSTFGYMLIGGIACILDIVTPLGAWKTTVSMIGKFCITASFGIIYIYSAEIFPTPIRSVGIGICSMSARVAGILAPIVLLLDEYWEHLPVVIFGSTSIAAAILVLFLPETLGELLPQTIEEGELLGTSKEKAPPIEEGTYKPDEKVNVNDTEANGHTNEGFNNNEIELEEKVA